MDVELDGRWSAVLRRDPDCDGAFVYAVRTTGVYCRPSCGARRARRENVDFFATGAEAEAAGYRPCKRCRPDGAAASQASAALMTGICRMIEAAEESPSLSELADAAGISPSHFHRLFRETVGLTPKAYIDADRAKRVRRELLRAGSSVTDAIYAAGFSSSGRFYDISDRVLGMTPTDFRAGGPNTDIRFGFGASSLGLVLVARSARGVCAILLGDDRDGLIAEVRSLFPKAAITDDEAFQEMVAAVVALVEEPAGTVDLPLDIRGTAFQRRVWQALLSVPPGETTTYAALADRLGRPRAVRAVGRACAANPLAIAIPCHRVLRSDGSPAGYRWGIARKRALLERERGKMLAGAGDTGRK